MADFVEQLGQVWQTFVGGSENTQTKTTEKPSATSPIIIGVIVVTALVVIGFVAWKLSKSKKSDN